MKTSVLKQILYSILCFFVMSASNVSAQINEIGAKGALQDSSITLEKALIYALQDEYAAQARYNAIIRKFGSVKPFNRIQEVEQTHIQSLLPLFKAYNVAIPNNTDTVASTPASLKTAFRVGIEEELDNIAMYTKFLKVPGIPPDVQKVMTTIRNDSLNHLAAFQAGLSRS